MPSAITCALPGRPHLRDPLPSPQQGKQDARRGIMSCPPRRTGHLATQTSPPVASAGTSQIHTNSSHPVRETMVFGPLAKNDRVLIQESLSLLPAFFDPHRQPHCFLKASRMTTISGGRDCGYARGSALIHDIWNSSCIDIEASPILESTLIFVHCTASIAVTGRKMTGL